MPEQPHSPRLKPDETKMQLIEYGPYYKKTTAQFYAIDQIEDRIEDSLADIVSRMDDPVWFREVLVQRKEILELPDEKVQPMFKERIALLKEYYRDISSLVWLSERRRAIDVLGRYHGAIAYQKGMTVSDEDWIWASNRRGSEPIAFETVKEGRT